MKEMSATALKNNLGRAFQHVAKGEKVLIKVRGKPFAVLEPSKGRNLLSPNGADVRPYEEAWADITATLAGEKPPFRNWKEAARWARKR
jgi:antitoxin (DNA-binding transcriptional repressor) of toxin-antitoxin stability system